MRAQKCAIINVREGLKKKQKKGGGEKKEIRAVQKIRGHNTHAALCSNLLVWQSR